MDELLGSGASASRLGGTSCEILERILAVFADSVHLNSGEEGLTYEEILDEVASLDSIAVLEFLIAVEKEFGVKLEPAVLEFEFLRDVRGLASHIEDRTRRPSGQEENARPRSAANQSG
jgi:acyl carrier protein